MVPRRRRGLAADAGKPDADADEEEEVEEAEGAGSSSGSAEATSIPPCVAARSATCARRGA